jgi:hypothetical protein
VQGASPCLGFMTDKKEMEDLVNRKIREHEIRFSVLGLVTSLCFLAGYTTFLLCLIGKVFDVHLN